MDRSGHGTLLPPTAIFWGAAAAEENTGEAEAHVQWLETRPFTPKFSLMQAWAPEPQLSLTDSPT